MAYYVKVTKQVADKMGLTAIRNMTADENVLLWQADLNSIEGDTIFDRAARVGGVALTPQSARLETDGMDNPAEVTTPDEYRDDEPTVLPEVDDETTTDQEGGGDE
ncbi:hypothetical protein [Phocaeicola coprocola]|uniref:hypothetical protein n=1 Tax=Phocaeicola coprocola TaxID=310298 RepID=UPI0020CB5325|nr:hypothetical protein [Phocaeicola coprocola]